MKKKKKSQQEFIFEMRTFSFTFGLLAFFLIVFALVPILKDHSWATAGPYLFFASVCSLASFYHGVKAKDGVKKDKRI